ncbi:hypothetical protein [Moorena producens]|nr:hypothetical protein [Moorena producens]
MQSASGGNQRQSLMVRSYRKTVEPCLDAVAHGGNPQDRANHANQ